ncbi:peptidoglycan DD-metalloendopeptidase family protein [Salininema proteolyticum]|uniref:Peptidoglycan DD-metalloendopeptidase family protein n=1 Tax=Salininema proteolyticum TaxID=1607685 RepID=A0ABV8U2W9_9ACTN
MSTGLMRGLLTAITAATLVAGTAPPEVPSPFPWPRPSESASDESEPPGKDKSSEEPTKEPKRKPTDEPSDDPGEDSGEDPTAGPSKEPSDGPSDDVTGEPTDEPAEDDPSESPSASSSPSPSASPSPSPSATPSPDSDASEEDEKKEEKKDVESDEPRPPLPWERNPDFRLGDDSYGQLPLEAVKSEFGRLAARSAQVRHRVEYLLGVAERADADVATANQSLVEGAESMLELLDEAEQRWGLPEETAGKAVPELLGEIEADRNLSGPERQWLGDLTGLAVELSDRMARTQVSAGEVVGVAERVRAEIDRLREEAEDLADKVDPSLLAEEGDGGVWTVDAPFLNPVEGAMVSGFGMRHDPYYKREQLHEGQDFAVGMGADIRAAASGTVVSAGKQGGYGLLTCIDHGRFAKQSLWTCYAHQSEILVEEGQTVDSGDVIGEVGSTGASTGPHLHFEVRVSGVAVDPRLWLARD